MNGKKKINKKHTDYLEYIEKCRALSDKYIKLEKEKAAQYPDWKGLDNPAADAIYSIKRQFHKELKALQTQYSHLFGE